MSRTVSVDSCVEYSVGVDAYHAISMSERACSKRGALQPKLPSSVRASEERATYDLQQVVTCLRTVSRRENVVLCIHT